MFNSNVFSLRQFEDIFLSVNDAQSSIGIPSTQPFAAEATKYQTKAGLFIPNQQNA
jgi:hypothetical protein